MKIKSENISIILTMLIVAHLTARADSALTSDPDTPIWATTWATANKTISAFDAPLPNINNATLRQVVRISRGGLKVRVSFTNEFGDRPLSINEAHIAKRDHGAAIIRGSSEPLTFSGATTIVIPPGARCVSDPVDMAVVDHAELVISTYLPDDITGSESPVTYHVRALQTNYIAAGNRSGANDFANFETTTAWHFLANVDVANSSLSPVIAMLGDSITDGDQQVAPNEPIDLNARYPDLLSEAINASGKAASVVNLGISGHQVLQVGQSPAERIRRHVLSLSGVTHIVYLEGINDIGFPVLMSALGSPTPTNSAAKIIAGHQQLIRHAKDAGLFIIGGTLTPSGGSALPGYHGATAEKKRQQINACIRNRGASDAVIDFDAALADPENPTIMRADLTADGLHPNVKGYQVMAQTALIAINKMIPNKRNEAH